MGTQIPAKKGHSPPIFGPCLLWPAAGWIKMPLGMEVGLGPGHTVLDGIQLPLERGTAAPPPLFGPWLLWSNGRPSQLLLSSFFFSSEHTRLCMEADHATSVRWSMSPTCLVDQHSALPDRTVCGFRRSNCQPSAVERFQSQQLSFGTVCPTTSRQPIRCRLSGSN